MGWINCESCLTEFKVITDSDNPIEYCPMCGADLDITEDEDFYEEPFDE